ncbi:MAG: hypothetical protein V2A73_11100 [Pseudomonadota bacterium]
MRSFSRSSPDLLLILGGPIAFGAVLGLYEGLDQVFRRACAFPLTWLGTALLMTPALYLGTSMLGLAGRAARVPAAIARGLRAGGLALLGVCPACAFLVTTAGETDEIVHTVGFGVASAAAFIGLRAVFLAMVSDEAREDSLLGDDTSGGGRPAVSRSVGAAVVLGNAYFAGWSFVGLVLGAAFVFSYVMEIRL